MSSTTWVQIVNAIIADGTAVTAAAESLLVPDVSIPAGYMKPYSVLRGRLAGKASCVVTTPGTQLFRVRWGGLSGVVLAATAALTQNVIVQTDKQWWWEFLITCRTDLATGTFLTEGVLQRGNCAAAAFADITPDMMPASGNAVVSVDTTIAKLLSCTVQPSLSTASITAQSYILESLNI